MAELTVTERLQPSLLDRLTDDDPGAAREPRARRVLSLPQLREAVLRDLAWLFNADNLECVRSLEELPDVRSSVLNYGIAPLSGRTRSSLSVAEVERRLRQAILDFEPRLLPETVVVRAIVANDEDAPNALAFEIEGALWAQPIPLALFLKTDIDLEEGTVAVSETTGRHG